LTGPANKLYKSKSPQPKSTVVPQINKRTQLRFFINSNVVDILTHDKFNALVDDFGYTFIETYSGVYTIKNLNDKWRKFFKRGKIILKKYYNGAELVNGKNVVMLRTLDDDDKEQKEQPIGDVTEFKFSKPVPLKFITLVEQNKYPFELQGTSLCIKRPPLKLDLDFFESVKSDYKECLQSVVYHGLNNQSYILYENTVKECEHIVPGYTLIPIAGDGNCFYTSIGTAMGQSSQQVRQAMANVVTQDFINNINAIKGNKIYTIQSYQKNQILKNYEYVPHEGIVLFPLAYPTTGLIILNPGKEGVCTVSCYDKFLEKKRQYIIVLFRGKHYDLISLNNKTIVPTENLPSTLIEKIKACKGIQFTPPHMSIAKSLPKPLVPQSIVSKKPVLAPKVVPYKAPPQVPKSPVRPPRPPVYKQVSKLQSSKTVPDYLLLNYMYEPGNTAKTVLNLVESITRIYLNTSPKDKTGSYNTEIYHEDLTGVTIKIINLDNDIQNY
jgi:hypothetical protein